MWTTVRMRWYAPIYFHVVGDGKIMHTAADRKGRPRDGWVRGVGLMREVQTSIRLASGSSVGSCAAVVDTLRGAKSVVVDAVVDTLW